MTGHNAGQIAQESTLPINTNSPSPAAATTREHAVLRHGCVTVGSLSRVKFGDFEGGKVPTCACVREIDSILYFDINPTVLQSKISADKREKSFLTIFEYNFPHSIHCGYALYDMHQKQPYNQKVFVSAHCADIKQPNYGAVQLLRGPTHWRRMWMRPRRKSPITRKHAMNESVAEVFYKIVDMRNFP
ncbi:MAG: hypothetical protein LBI34_02460 [Puniceicoccales bacterium]|nr:hypothetical protein [Puniceicoccales bacterium]